VVNKGSEEFDGTEKVSETFGRVTSTVEVVRVLNIVLGSIGSVMLVVVVTIFKGVIETFIFCTSVEGLFSVNVKGAE